jgi:hypothetical protein
VILRKEGRVGIPWNGSLIVNKKYIFPSKLQPKQLKKKRLKLVKIELKNIKYHHISLKG